MSVHNAPQTQHDHTQIASVPMRDRDLLRWLFSRGRPHWRVALIAMLAMVATAALEPVLPALMQPLIDKTLINKDPTSLWQVPLFIMLAFAAKGVADYVANVASQHLAQHTIAELRSEIFAHELDLTLKAHQERGAGAMVAKITYDTGMIAETLSSAWLIVVRDTLILVGLGAFLFYTAWQLALMVVVTAPLVAIVIRRASRVLRTSNKNLQLWTGKITGLINESLLGLREIKIFNHQSARRTKFDQANHVLRDEQMRIIRAQALNVPLVQVIAAFAVALVIFVASLLSSKNLLSPGEFVSFITAVAMVFEPVRRLTNINPVVQKGLAAAQSVRELLLLPAEEPRQKGETSPLPANASQRAQGRIEFRAVRYAYPGRDQPVLEDFNLILAPGTSAAIVGESGSGKSTILYLLAGFDHPQSGEILVDDRYISEWSLSNLRSNIGLVSQSVLLFDGTVAENILVGKPSASRGEIEQAARLANAWEFIDQMPQGLDTPLGDLGSKLSGGQRQRIAIARALLKNAPILLLDEATSALDQEGEREVLQAIETLMHGRTTIFVSHAPERLPETDQKVTILAGKSR